MIRIICVGKKHESWISAGVERYESRLKKPFTLEWVLLPHSAKQGVQARVSESEAILSRISSNDFVIVLDEIGTSLSSTDFAQKISTAQMHAKNIVCIIGGAYGVDDTIHERADVVISLSRLVFPHQLVRLILSEQLYRAQEIVAGRPYHHS